MTRSRGPLVVVLLLSGASGLLAEPRPTLVASAPQRFQLFPAPPALAPSAPLADLDAVKPESLVRLPGDSDSVFTLGGRVPSGQPHLRFAVEVNEVILKALSPDPKIDSSDPKGRSGGDWKPLDAAGRPYQLRFGARLIW